MRDEYLDALDWDEFEAEQERLHRLRERQAHEFDIEDERIDERNELIRD